MDTEPTASTAHEDFYASGYGTRQIYGWPGYRRACVTDPAFDARLAIKPSFHRLARKAARVAARRIHIASVDIPARRDELEGVLRELKNTRHAVTVSLAPLENRGKFENINKALQNVDLSSVDWLIVVDDDVALPARFLDRFIYASEAASLRIAQPAHRFRSYTSWELTQRVWNSLVRTTHFVECGPITAFHRDVFQYVLPFPYSQSGWGLDVIWGEIARDKGFSIGIVDATPITHLREVAENYDRHAATRESVAMLERFGVRRTMREVLTTTAMLSRL